MIEPTDDDADFKMMSTPDEWPVWPILPLKNGPWTNRRHAVLVSTHLRDDSLIYFLEGATIFDKVPSAQLTEDNKLTPEKIRELVNAGWQVD